MGGMPMGGMAGDDTAMLDEIGAELNFDAPGLRRIATVGDVLDFLDSGAGDELTLRRNREAFARSAAPTARSPTPRPPSRPRPSTTCAAAAQTPSSA